MILWFVLAVLVCRRSFAAPAAYGRYAPTDAGSSIKSSWGWVIMESPTVIVMGILFLVGPFNNTPPAYALLAIWMAHYLQRTFLYPFLRRDMDRRIPWSIVISGMVFNVLNGYLNGRYVFPSPADTRPSG